MKKKCILSFFFSMVFILMMANPALTQEDGLKKGVCVGGGEWVALFPPYVSILFGLIRHNLKPLQEGEIR